TVDARILKILALCHIGYLEEAAELLYKLFLGKDLPEKGIAELGILRNEYSQNVQELRFSNSEYLNSSSNTEFINSFSKSDKMMVTVLKTNVGNIIRIKS